MMLGILGGMGPLAGAQFLARLTLLTPAERDQDHLPCVLWSDPRVPDRTAARLGTGPDPLPALLRGLRALEAAGATAIAIPCNTAHGWFDDMRAACPLPILHIVDAAAADLARQGVAPGPIGLLATEGTLAMRLYQQRLEAAGWDVLVPDAATMADVVSPAIAAIKAGAVGPAGLPLRAAAAGLVARGARAVVLGCTEIPLGLPEGPLRDSLGVPVVDTIDALALAAIGWARG
ncbi:aspartate/glutamate racemase family protein [Humitalea sp. 24SJ18S-53]|uniref:aspartate/glutamate racemase family protein n=1 Tax=Humitalea sp. 24SJ18S-53 TaxID=3422307 RepID=UPI003D672441